MILVRLSSAMSQVNGFLTSRKAFVHVSQKVQATKAQSQVIERGMGLIDPMSIPCLNEVVVGRQFFKDSNYFAIILLRQRCTHPAHYSQALNVIRKHE